jgi:transcriptional regulator with XRE-family HTH domain
MDETPQPRLGIRLRRARTRLELTQEQVARAVGFVPTVYGRIERGDMLPSVPKLRDLCQLLGISADTLLSLNTEERASANKAPAQAPADNAPAQAPAGNAPAHSTTDALELRRLSVLVREMPPERFRLFVIALEWLTHPEEE